MWFENSYFLQKDIFNSLCILLSERYLLLTKTISITILKVRCCFPSHPPLISVTMFAGIWQMNFLALILRTPVSSLGKKRRYSAWCFENSLVFWCQCKTKKFSNSKCYNLAIFLHTSLRCKCGYYKNVDGQSSLCTILIVARVFECLLIFTLFLLVMIHECLCQISQQQSCARLFVFVFYKKHLQMLSSCLLGTISLLTG